MEKRTINTKLKHRDDAFKMLALAEATGYPILLEGPPGIGKTNVLLDYARAKFNSDEEAHAKCFIIETDEGTKQSEIRGRVDIEKLVQTPPVYGLEIPLLNAHFVLINEVDKASSAFRNSMLSAMNEKILMEKGKVHRLPWDVWAASCNMIPEDEKGSPFWDRFVLKYKMDRMSKKQTTDVMLDGTTLSDNTVTVTVPTAVELDAMQLNEHKLTKFTEHTYKVLSDRTLLHSRRIINAIRVIYNCDESNAMVRAAALLAGPDVSNALSKDIEPRELIAVREAIEKLKSHTDTAVMERECSNVQKTIKTLLDSKVIDAATYDQLKEQFIASASANKYIVVNMTGASGATAKV
jgi:MoxR-like ATPase